MPVLKLTLEYVPPATFPAVPESFKPYAMHLHGHILVRRLDGLPAPLRRYLYRRLIHHEVDHALDPDFRQDDHHPWWHFCGRTMRWPGVFSHRHLVSPIEITDALLEQGEAYTEPLI